MARAESFRSGGARRFDRIAVGPDLAASAQIDGLLRGSKGHDWPSLIDGATSNTTVPVVGAALGDFVIGVSLTASVAGVLLWGAVTAADTVTVYAQNESGGTVDLSTQTLAVLVAKVDANV